MSDERIAFLGLEGSYSYQAAKALYPDAQLKGFPNFTDVVAAVDANEADIVVIPVENSITGRIPDVHRMMLTTQLQIVGEYMLPVVHCFIRPQTPPSADVTGRRLKTLYSHQQGFLQCRGYIESHFPEAELIELGDTASAVRTAAASNDPGVGAIGSAAAAEVYGAVIVDEDIADTGDNVTRFLVLVRPEVATVPDDADMTTMIFQVQHQPGSLLKALTVFQEEGINLTKLETYTISRQTLLPTFYVDLGAGLHSEQMRSALKKLKEKTAFMKLLGSYKSSDTRKMTSGFLPASERDQS